MTVQIIFLVFVFILICTVGLLSWYKRKEEQELKAVEFKIIAAEHDLNYVEDGDFYHTYLSQLGLLSGVDNIHITNMISRWKSF